LPPAQVLPGSQGVAQSPQCSGSVSSWTHAPLQLVFPEEQVVAHCELSQT
jgi:hypothetical protein